MAPSFTSEKQQTRAGVEKDNDEVKTAKRTSRKKVIEFFFFFFPASWSRGANQTAETATGEGSGG